MLDLTFFEDRLGEDVSLRYWNRERLQSVFSADSYKEMANLALNFLRDMPKPIGQVCGPITTGGLGSIELNLDVFNRTIRKLMEWGEVIFNQMPFEYPMQNLRMRSKLPGEETDALLLNEFYLPIFNSGLVKRLYFIRGWESSFGARWEHQKAKELGINRLYLETGFHLK